MRFRWWAGPMLTLSTSVNFINQRHFLVLTQHHPLMHAGWYSDLSAEVQVLKAAGAGWVCPVLLCYKVTFWRRFRFGIVLGRNSSSWSCHLSFWLHYIKRYFSSCSSKEVFLLSATFLCYFSVKTDSPQSKHDLYRHKRGIMEFLFFVWKD